MAKKLFKGAEFLITEATARRTSSSRRTSPRSSGSIAVTADQFVEAEVVPVMHALEAHDMTAGRRADAQGRRRRAAR